MMPGDNLCFVMGKFNQTRAEARREKLIEAARALFAENGFHATGMAEIARRSGIAVGQIYRDFAGKEDIVAEIVTRDCALFLSAATLKNAIEADDVAAVRAWIDKIVEPDQSDDENENLFAEIIAESKRNARIADIFDTVHTDVRQNLLTALGVVLPTSVAADRLETVADTILTISLGLMHHRLMGKDEHSPALISALRGIVDREIRALEGAA
jgi:AcrR family transcriptional regulator